MKQCNDQDGDSVLGQQQVPACSPARPVSTQMHSNEILASVFEIFRHKSSILKTDRPPSLCEPFPPHTHTHTLSLSGVLCTHFNLVKQLSLETIDVFRYISFLLAASLLPQHPPSFSKVFLFRETIVPWDIVRQAGRQTEHVFFFPPSLFLSLTLY